MHVMDENLRTQDNGRKRHLAVDAAGLLLVVVITPPGSRIATRPGRCCGTCTAPAGKSG
jgi:hypothetical protein